MDTGQLCTLSRVSLFLRANRLTHNAAGEKIIYVDWGDETGIPGPDVDDDTRIKWANDVLGGDETEDN